MLVDSKSSFKFFIRKEHLASHKRQKLTKSLNYSLKER